MPLAIHQNLFLFKLTNNKSAYSYFFYYLLFLFIFKITFHAVSLLSKTYTYFTNVV